MTESKQERNQLAELRQEPVSFRHELHRKHFGLTHHSPQDFHRSQWQKEEKSCIYLVYRWCLAAFFGSGLTSYLKLYFFKGHWFIYLTNWGFLLCGITTLCGAIFVTIYHTDPQKMLSKKCLIKLHWAFYWINLILSHIISIVYWTCVYPSDRKDDNPVKVSTLFNIWTHVLPPFVFTIDHLVVAHPSRLLHFIYPLMFSLGYMGFTLLYYILGGHDPRGRDYIYPMLNYSKPVRTLKTLGMVTTLLLCCSLLQYGVYRLRVFIARKLNKLQ